MIDAHCHLYMLEDDERAAAMLRARTAGVARILVPSTHEEDAPLAMALAESEAGMFAAVGFHPHEASRFDAGAHLPLLRQWLANPRVVAVGEVGLDFHYMHSPRETQIEVLRAQLALALELDVPAILHNRESDEELLAILAEPGLAGLRAVFHSFTGGRELAERVVAMGFDLSFSGMVTFASANAIREAAAWCPLDRLLIETDTPFLAPVPHRGKRNEPAFVVEVAKRIGAVKGIPGDAVGDAAARNFARLFRA